MNTTDQTAPLEDIKTEPLVLHICCAPDEAYVVHTLRDQYDLHCFWCNPNIQPEEEYRKRVDEARKVAGRYGVPFDTDSYAPVSWENAIDGHEESGEGGRRCYECFLLRLRRTAAFCKENGYPAFTTVMSVSPHKKIAMLNETGRIAAEDYGLSYVPFDFKKKNGFLESVRLSNELGLYRQDYCGCRLSKAEAAQRREARSRK